MVNEDHVSLRFARNTNFNPIYLRDAMVNLMTRPPRQETPMSTDVAIPTEAEIVPVAAKKFKPVETAIDHLADFYRKLVKARADKKQLEAYITELESTIKAELLARGATDGKIKNAVVVTYRPKEAYRMKEFSEAYPEIYARYMEPVIVDKLNEAKLISDHGGLLEAFRSSAVNVK